MKRYISAASQSSLIPESCKKYYKWNTNVDEWEVEELPELFESYGLEWIGPLCGKSKYAEILEFAEINSVSLCTSLDGTIGVYALTNDGVRNITRDVPYIIERAQEDYY